jgi:threonine dehydratase
MTPHVYHTPLVTSRILSERTGFDVRLKAELFQRTGSYKIRGPLNKFTFLSDDQKRRGVICSSAGNHAQGVALAAQIVGTTAIVCMPGDAPALKVTATRGFGAEVVFYDRLKDDREAVARTLAHETGRVLIPPFDDYAIMAGQGTAALELLEDVPSLDVLVTPVGGGGLMSGCSTAAKALAPDITVIGVEPESGNDVYLSMARGEIVTIPPPPTMADGVRTTSPGKLTFPVLQANVDRIALVSESDIAAAVRSIVLNVRVVAEPTGAVGAAAVLTGTLGVPRGARVGVVLSGGNIDPDLLVSLLRADATPS